MQYNNKCSRETPIKMKEGITMNTLLTKHLLTKQFLNKFKQGDIAVHCSKKKQTEKLFEFLKKNGFKWISGSELDSKDTKWNNYKEETCYNYDSSRGICFADINYFKNEFVDEFENGYKIIDFED